MFLKKIPTLFLFSLILVQLCRCQSPPNGSKPTSGGEPSESEPPKEGFLSSLSKSADRQSIFKENMKLVKSQLSQYLENVGNKPITGPIQAVMQILNRVISLLQNVEVYGGLLIQDVIAELFALIGGSLDDLLRSLPALVRGIFFHLGGLPKFMGGGIYKDIDEKQEMCKSDGPPIIIGAFQQAAGCITLHLADISKDLYKLNKHLIEVFEMASDHLKTMAKTPLLKIPSMLWDLLTSEIGGPLGDILKKLGALLLSVVKLLPGLLICMAKTIAPALWTSLKLVFYEIKCLLSGKENAEKAKKLLDEALTDLRKNYKSNSA